MNTIQAWMKHWFSALVLSIIWLLQEVWLLGLLTYNTILKQSSDCELEYDNCYTIGCATVRTPNQTNESLFKYSSVAYHFVPLGVKMIKKNQWKRALPTDNALSLSLLQIDLRWGQNILSSLGIPGCESMQEMRTNKIYFEKAISFHKNGHGKLLGILLAPINSINIQLSFDSLVKGKLTILIYFWVWRILNLIQFKVHST